MLGPVATTAPINTPSARIDTVAPGSIPPTWNWRTVCELPLLRLVRSSDDEIPVSVLAVSTGVLGAELGCPSGSVAESAKMAQLVAARPTRSGIPWNGVERS